MCLICEEFKWLKDLPDDHPKVIMLINELEDMAKDEELIKWQQRLAAFLEELKNKDTTGYPGDTTGEEPTPDDPPVDPDPGTDTPDPDDPEPTPDDPGEGGCHCDCNCNGNCG